MDERGTTLKQDAVRVWEKIEIVLKSQKSYSNPYMEVEVWVDLRGPGFQRRVYGFWDGENIFRIRAVATAPGEWVWASGSNHPDIGLNGKTGRFTAISWTEEQKEENPTRRGFLRPTAKDTLWSMPMEHRVSSWVILGGLPRRFAMNGMMTI